jgi:Barstar (barnase inhibitor)
MARVQLDGDAIVDWQTFHAQCASVFGFPDFYGANMNAWIDCLTYVRGGDGMSRFQLGPDEPLIVDVIGTQAFNQRAPEVFDAFVACAAAVNRRQIEAGEVPALHLVFR